MHYSIVHAKMCTTFLSLLQFVQSRKLQLGHANYLELVKKLIQKCSNSKPGEPGSHTIDSYIHDAGACWIITSNQ